MRRNKIVKMQQSPPRKQYFLFKIINKYILCVAQKMLDKDVSVFIMGRMLQCSV